MNGYFYRIENLNVIVYNQGKHVAFPLSYFYSKSSFLGFSIKSQLGDPSTLLNASVSTNVIYKVIDTKITSMDLNRINTISTRRKIKDRFKEIRKLGGFLQYFDFDSSVFKNNLVLIDSCLPRIIANIVKIFYSSDLNTIKDIVEKLETENPLRFDTQHSHKFYEYKIKRFLTDVALGMMPATVWTGAYDATGGYLIVKEDGDILCYHIYNKNEFENYLFANTKLETASSSRNKFGIIEIVDGQQIFKLNLQIRFLN
ncbi:MAG: HpaII family restriction endonuclease [Cytophagaceae bacterium]|jgi:type II restriction enzyme|nr:HpaII family restriction endonuclease [Cytophagaceae bacterium]